MKIAVCIPCYKFHIPKLLRCLESIEEQTRKPDQVIVSCSSSTESDLPILDYSFPIQTLITNERKNAAENRNIASRAAKDYDVDILSYFDADDVMHPRRLEYIEQVFTNDNADIVFHNFEMANDLSTYDEWLSIDSITYIMNQITRSKESFGVVVSGTPHTKIHHSQVSIRKGIFDVVQFREQKRFERFEDSVFCSDCMYIESIQTAYITNSLSKYYLEGQTYNC